MPPEATLKRLRYDFSRRLLDSLLNLDTSLLLADGAHGIDSRTCTTITRHESTLISIANAEDYNRISKYYSTITSRNKCVICAYRRGCWCTRRVWLDEENARNAYALYSYRCQMPCRSGLVSVLSIHIGSHPLKSECPRRLSSKEKSYTSLCPPILSPTVPASSASKMAELVGVERRGKSVKTYKKRRSDVR